MEKNEEKNAIAAINEALTEAGCEYRLCAECGKIIKEGYYYSNAEFCCSDECGAKHEGVSVEDFSKEREEDENILEWCEGYWTTTG